MPPNVAGSADSQFCAVPLCLFGGIGAVRMPHLINEKARGTERRARNEGETVAQIGNKIICRKRERRAAQLGKRT